MKVEEFWNHAFVACLTRVPPKQAKKQADEATSLCIAHWQANMKNRGLSRIPLWQDQDVAHVPMVEDAYRALMRGEPAKIEQTSTLKKKEG